MWGHSLANVWGFSTQADELGLWAAANLVPEGPLPSMRIENQPYGLLPATSLARWQAAAGDPAIEARLVPLVRSLVATWAAAAERQAAQQQGDVLRGLVRNPTAARYAWQWMVPTTLAHALAFRFNQAVPARRPRSLVDTAGRADAAARPGRHARPAARAVGWAPRRSSSASSSRPTSGPKLTRLAGATVAELLAAGAEEGARRRRPPWGTSLLTELARHSLLASSAAVARRTVGEARAVVEPLERRPRHADADRGVGASPAPADLTRRGDPTVGVRANVVNGLKTLATKNTADIDRALRAALETATNRLDPWATAIAWRRLQSLAAAPRTLGVYGWVDAPRPQTPGDHRFVLAPSTEQAAMAAVLRDRALHDADADRWQMTLASDPVRGALQLADATREGATRPSRSGRRSRRS